MQKQTTLFLSLIFLLSGVNSHAQQAADQVSTKPTNSLNGGSIESQFEYILDNSNNYQEYKVVRKTYLDKIRTNVTDSIKSMRAEVSGAEESMSSHNQAVKTLQDSLSQTQASLDYAQKEKESFNFLGLLMPKSAYSSIVWSIIGILLVTLAIFIYRFRQSHEHTVVARKNLEELKEEFDQHRKRSMEREQRLNRQLQDELNKRL